MNVELMRMMGSGPQAPDVGSRTPPLNAPQAGANQDQLMQLLLQLLMRNLGGMDAQMNSQAMQGGGMPALQASSPQPPMPQLM
jgi:hypothetical protein